MPVTAKDQNKGELHPVTLGQGWEIFLPSELDEQEPRLDPAHMALRQAEIVIRAQEERIRHLEQMTLTDELTGLVNRRGFALAFERELALARRDANYGGILVMIDLDEFKAVNDTWGHQAGDNYLRTVAKVLREGGRSTDIVARLGGDEFALLLPQMDEKKGTRHLLKLEQSFAKRALLLSEHIPLRASFGFSVYNGSDSIEGVMESADLRLYAHKARHKALIIRE